MLKPSLLSLYSFFNFLISSINFFSLLKLKASCSMLYSMLSILFFIVSGSLTFLLPSKFFWSYKFFIFSIKALTLLLYFSLSFLNSSTLSLTSSFSSLTFFILEISWLTTNFRSSFFLNHFSFSASISSRVFFRLVISSLSVLNSFPKDSFSSAIYYQHKGGVNQIVTPILLQPVPHSVSLLSSFLLS